MGQRGFYDDEEPVHWVKIENTFYLGTFVVTQEQWGAVAEHCEVLRKEPGIDPSEFKGKPRHPVENVSLLNAKQFCEWLENHREEISLPEGFTPDLPDEVEWEYACRGGEQDIRTEYWNGDGEAALREVGWYQGNAGGTTHPVDEIVATQPESHPCGLYGLHGNVWEWCNDYWGENWNDENHAYRLCGGMSDHRHEFLTDFSESGIRVLRGGSWLVTAPDCRSAFRGRLSAGFRFWDFGFRLGLFSGSGGQVQGPEGGEQEAEGSSGGGSDGTEVRYE